MNEAKVQSGKKALTKPQSVYSCGFCAVGSHSGTRPTSPSGKPLPVCQHIFHPQTVYGRIIEVECMCPCNDTERGFRAMLQAAGKELSVNTSPHYALPRSDLQRPVHDDATSVVDGTAPTGNAALRPMVGKGGRVERGNLEELVRQVCLDGLNNKGIVPSDGMTPKWIAFEITLRSGSAYAPSTGAVSSVLVRWASTMQATIAEKPLRIVDLSVPLRHR